MVGRRHRFGTCGRRTGATLLAAVVGCGAGIGASAQPTADIAYDGKWSADIRGADGRRHVATVVIADFAGTWSGWSGDAARPNRPCGNRRLPLTVQESSADELGFTVWGSAASPDCVDLRVTLKPTARNVVEGTVDGLGEVRLKRR